jgi:ribosomal-protein-alanine N-acetyltransferase
MIRSALAHDIPDLAALHAKSFAEAQWSAAQIVDSLSLTTSVAFVAQEDAAPQGFILCQTTDVEAEILTFCVDPVARRRGVGHRLLEAALAAVRKKNIRRIFLEVAADNQAALALYEKAGFRPHGKRLGYYRRGAQTVDAIMLGLDL